MNIEDQLRVVISKELECLETSALGSEEYAAALDGVTKLMDRAIEMEKLNVDIQDREQAREGEKELKLKEIGEEHHDRIVKNCIAVASILIPTAVTIWGTLKSIEFEKEGTITTFAGRSFFGRLFPKK